MFARSTLRRITAAAALFAFATAGCAKVPPGGAAVPAPVPSGTPTAAIPSPTNTPSESHLAAPPGAPGDPSGAPDPSGSVSPSTDPGAPGTSSPTPTLPVLPLQPGWVTGKPVADRRIPPSEGNAHGPNTTDKVLLTFDDCPLSLEDFRSTVLGVEALGVRTVLFPMGSCITKGKFDVDFARQHGMFVYSHSVTHPQLTKLSDAAVRKQLEPPAVQGAWMRPPFGAVNPHVRALINAAGMKVWLWDFDTEDWRGKPQDQVVAEVVTYAQPGDTVLMHMQWHGFNPTAVAAMKQGLAARGIELCGLNGPATANGPLGC